VRRHVPVDARRPRKPQALRLLRIQKRPRRQANPSSDTVVSSDVAAVRTVKPTSMVLGPAVVLAWTFRIKAEALEWVHSGMGQGNP
jgi:hypothetical protein